MSSLVVTGASRTNLEIPDLFSLFSFFQGVNVSSFCGPLFERTVSLCHDIWLCPSVSLPPFFMVPCCCEQNSFFKRQMVAALFSLNKKSKTAVKVQTESRPTNRVCFKCWRSFPVGKRSYLNKMCSLGWALPRPQYRMMANNGNL